MKCLVLSLVLVASAAFAADLDVPLGGRTPVPNRKGIEQVVVRDPSMVKVVTTDGAVFLEGEESGVTGVTVTYTDNETETMLVTVGTATNSKGPRMQKSQTVDLKAMKSATAQVKKPDPADEKSAAKKEKAGAAVREAGDVVRAAVEAL